MNHQTKHVASALALVVLWRYEHFADLFYKLQLWICTGIDHRNRTRYRTQNEPNFLPNSKNSALFSVGYFPRLDGRLE